jgi:peptide/nickel transport system permease protein
MRRAVPFGRRALLLVAVAALVLCAPWFVSADPVAQDLMHALEAPSVAHPLGTDHLGRDILARIVHGAWRSLGIAVGCVVLSVGAGVALGMVAAYRGGIADAIIMRLADLTLAFPGLLLALLLAGLMGGGLAPLVIGIQLSLWPQFARLSRASARTTLAEAHVEAAKLAGFPGWRILVRHVLPPAMPQAATLGVLSVGSTIMAISSLGFLGLGLRPPAPEWGAMINEMLPYLAEAPLQVFAPCLCIFVTVLGLTMIAGPGAAKVATA